MNRAKLAPCHGDHYERPTGTYPAGLLFVSGAHYFKGQDAMRFYAKMGWDHAYMETRDRLLSIPCNI
ncbi:hypothetical protein NSS79_23880 [Paenibacillus sp. FSL L8-0436]|uniref:hypothetical protein n=1 Tax=Paenibacillus sp. FSL L8-0436 TaxID=2954686 RepID=UPI00315829B6